MCERNGYNKAHQPFMIDSFDEQRTRASRLHVYKSNCRCESRRARTCQTVGVCDTEPSLCRKLMTKSTSFSAALSRVVSVTVSAVCLTELSKTYRITVGRRLHSQATQTRHAVEISCQLVEHYQLAYILPARQRERGHWGRLHQVEFPGHNTVHTAQYTIA